MSDVIITVRLSAVQIVNRALAYGALLSIPLSLYLTRGQGGIVGIGAVLLILNIVMFAYFLPAFIAAHRKHSRALWILVLNLLAGWTFLAWLLALAWAMSKKRTETVALAESLINVECESQPSTAASSGAHRGLRRFLR